MKTHLAHKQVSITVQTADGPRTIPTGCATRAEAQALAQQVNLKAVEQAAKAGVITENLIRKLTTGGTITVAAAFAEWKDWIIHASNSERTSENSISQVNAWITFAKAAKLRVGQIKEEHISKWINAEDGTSLGTRRVRLASIRSFFMFCGIKEYLSRDPSALVRVKAHLLSHEQKEKKVRQCFSPEEFERLTDLLQQRIADLETKQDRTDQEEKRLDTSRFWYAATLIGRWSGLRLGDVCSLEWACFGKKGVMVVWTDKRDSRVELPVGEDLAHALSTIPTNARKHCFPEQHEMAHDTHQRSTLSVQFMRLLKEADIYGKSYHSLRHTLATELNAEGETIEAIAKALGHKNTKTTKGYIKTQ